MQTALNSTDGAGTNGVNRMQADEAIRRLVSSRRRLGAPIPGSDDWSVYTAIMQMFEAGLPYSLVAKQLGVDRNELMDACAKWRIPIPRYTRCPGCQSLIPTSRGSLHFGTLPCIEKAFARGVFCLDDHGRWSVQYSDAPPHLTDSAVDQEGVEEEEPAELRVVAAPVVAPTHESRAATVATIRKPVKVRTQRPDPATAPNDAKRAPRLLAGQPADPAPKKAGDGAATAAALPAAISPVDTRKTLPVSAGLSVPNTDAGRAAHRALTGTTLKDWEPWQALSRHDRGEVLAVLFRVRTGEAERIADRLIKGSLDPDWE